VPHARPPGVGHVHPGGRGAGGQALGVGGEQLVGPGLDQQRRQAGVGGQQRRDQRVGPACRVGVRGGAGLEPARQRVLLAALLLDAGNPVAVDALAEMVWDGSPPSGAAVTLRSHVLRLRRVLGRRAGARLVTRHPGCLLHAGEDEVDELRFRGLCRDGGTALRGGAWARADELLCEALALWRGTPLADVPSERLLREEAPGLEELRLQAEEWRADAALPLGRHDEFVAVLQSLATKHPLRERFHVRRPCRARRRPAWRRARCGPARWRAIRSLGGDGGHAPPASDRATLPRPRTCRARRSCTADGSPSPGPGLSLPGHGRSTRCRPAGPGAAAGDAAGTRR
jgi:Bacterial transcriptional activator domain/Transcriptional regulatory protein, C terminal